MAESPISKATPHLSPFVDAMRGVEAKARELNPTRNDTMSNEKICAACGAVVPESVWCSQEPNPENELDALCQACLDDEARSCRKCGEYIALEFWPQQAEEEEPYCESCHEQWREEAGIPDTVEGGSERSEATDTMDQFCLAMALDPGDWLGDIPATVESLGRWITEENCEPAAWGDDLDDNQKNIPSLVLLARKLSARQSMSTTPRGFAKIEVTDTRGCVCRLQRSSSAMEDAVWIFCDDPNRVYGDAGGTPHLNSDQARQVAAGLLAFADNADSTQEVHHER